MPLSNSNDEPVAESERVRALVNVNVTDVVFHLQIVGERFLEINPAFTKATGLEAEAVVGKFVDAVIPEPSLSLVLSKYREAIASRRTVRWEEVTDYPTGKRIGEVSVTPVVDAKGRCTSLIGTVHDVTEVRQQSETIRLYADMVQAVQIGLAVWDVPEPGNPLSIKLAAFNPAAERLSGVSLSSRIGAGPSEFLQGDGASEIASLLCEVARDGTSRELPDYRIATGPERATVFALKGFALPGHHVGLAIEDVTSRHEFDEQLRALSARIEAAREDERTGIAREIHDELGQALTAIKLDLSWIARRLGSSEDLTVLRQPILERVSTMSAMTDEVIQQVRRISAELRPGVLDDLGLLAAIEWQAHDFEHRVGVSCTVVSNLGDERLDRTLSTALFRIFQESLTNAARHAHAKRMEVTLTREPASVRLVVTDDGTGIAADVARSPKSIGLLGIRERARRLGGRAVIAARAHGGTVVSVEVPLAPAAPQAAQ